MYLVLSQRYDISIDGGLVLSKLLTISDLKKIIRIYTYTYKVEVKGTL